LTGKDRLCRIDPDVNLSGLTDGKRVNTQHTSGINKRSVFRRKEKIG